MTQTSAESADGFAARLVLAMKTLNFSRGQLAAAIGVDKSLVSRWASGQVIPTGYNLARISEALAKAKPGFNMTYWERPRAEFDAFFGAGSASPNAPNAYGAAQLPGGTAPAPKIRPFADLVGSPVSALIALAAVTLAVLWIVFGPSGGALVGRAPAALPAAPANTIAVLPFASTTDDASQRYFGEGLADELTGLLARNAALRVAARTSAFSFEGKKEDIRSIAKKLDVRAILEGNVQSQNGRVRIEASLIDAENGYQVWSQSYDRSLSDILVVQSDIAHAIAVALVPKLLHATGGAPQAHAVDPVAYRRYLEGLVDMNQRREDMEKAALPLLRQATGRAPDFAAAQAALAYDLYLIAANDDQFGPNTERDAALTRALRLDPANPLALSLSIDIALQNRAWDKAIDMALALKRSGDHSVDTLRGVASVYEEFGLSTLQLSAWRDAVRLDPLSYNARMNLATTEIINFSRRRDALDVTKEALKLNPGNPLAMAFMCHLLADTKQIAAAKAALEGMKVSGAPQDTLDDCRFGLAQATGDIATQHRICDDNVAHYPENGQQEYDVGFCFALAGEFDRALDWFERAYDKSTPGPGEDVFNLPFARVLPPALFQEPRWIALTKRPGFQRWSEARARARRLFGG